MEKTTTEITLPESKARVLLFDKLSNFQSREISKLLMSNIKVKANASEEEMAKELDNIEISMALTFEMQDMTLRFLIAEIFDESGAKVGNADDFIKELSQEDADILYKKAGEISAKSRLSDESKKK